MFLEIATTLGALLGAYLTTKISTHWIAIVFGVVLLYAAVASFRKKSDTTATNRRSFGAASSALWNLSRIKRR